MTVKHQHAAPTPAGLVRRTVTSLLAVGFAAATLIIGAALVNGGVRAHATVSDPVAATETFVTTLPSGYATRVRFEEQVDVAAARDRLQERAERMAERRAEVLARLQESAHDRSAEILAARLALAQAHRWVLPVSGYGLSAPFGAKGPLWEADHTGQDFSIGAGAPVVAVAAGTVVFAAKDGPYGNKVEIWHEDGVETWYAHLSVLAVETGDQVRPGDEVGLVGSTGNSTGPHLHFEVWRGGQRTDPVRFLARRGVTV